MPYTPINIEIFSTRGFRKRPVAWNEIKRTLESISLLSYMLTYLIVFNVTLFFAPILTSNWFTEIPNIKKWS